MKFEDFKNEGSEAAVKVFETIVHIGQDYVTCFHCIYYLLSILLSGCRKVQTTRACLCSRRRRYYFLQVQCRCRIKRREKEVMARVSHVVARPSIHQHDSVILLHASPLR